MSTKLSTAKKITLINQVTLGSLNEVREFDIVKKFVLAGIDVLNADYGFSWFREKNDQNFRWVYKSPTIPYTPQTPRKQGVMAKAFDSEIPLLIDDVVRAGFVRADVKNYMKSVAVIPVRYKSQKYGTLVICYKHKHVFSREEESLTTFLGNSAAQAITINRLYTDLKEFKNTLDSTLDSILIFNEKTLRIEYVNQGVISEIGLPKSRLLKSKVFELHRGFSEQSFRTHIDPLLVGKQKSFLYESEFITALNKVIPVEIFLQRTHDTADGGRFLAIVRDITDRKKSEAALKRSESYNRFLAEAGRILSSSLDYRTTLKSVADLAVPQLGDWCIIDMVGGNRELKRIAVAHTNSGNLAAADKLHTEYPADIHGTGAVAQVLKSGVPGFYPDISEKMLREAARDEKHFHLLKKAGLKSAILVPLKTQDQCIGIITLISTSARTYKISDLALAEELARRASLAIENSFLYTDMEERVRQRTRDLIQANEILKAEIKERKAAEDRLRESEKRLSEAQALAHLGSWEWDLASDVVTWSGELCRIYGVDQGFVGSYADVKKRVHPQDRAMFEQMVETALKNKTSYQFFHRIVRHDSNERILSAYGEVVTNPNGKIVKLIGTAQDVTERRHAEIQLEAHAKTLEKNRAALAQEKAKDEAVLSGLGEGVVATDNRGRLTIFNKEAERLLKLKAKDVLGKFIFEVQPMFDEQGVEVPFENRPAHLALAKGKKITIPANKPMYLQRGKIRFPVALTVTPIIMNRKIIGAVQIVRDITQEREIDKVKSELISLVSHQLRTPLSAINWYTETLIKEEVGKINPQQKKYLQEIFDANKKMVELVYGFLNVSRIELGTFSLKLTSLNIVETARSVLQELAPLIEQKRLAVKEQYPSTPPVFEFDRKIIRIIFQNLLTNSVKYTKHRGKISINVKVVQKGPRKKLQISVSDNGVGIPKKQQGKIFSKLFRADNVAKLDTEGTGLGLYIVKSFVDYIGGSIRFASTENKGTTFYVELPIKKSPALSGAGLATRLTGARVNDETKK